MKINIEKSGRLGIITLGTDVANAKKVKMPLEVNPVRNTNLSLQNKISNGVKLTPKLTYKLRLSPQMRLSLNLLQLPLAKLKEYVIEQIEKNPLLEPASNGSISADKQISVIDSEQEGMGSETTWSEEDEEKRQYRENLITTSPTLQEHLLKQLHLFVNSNEERKIGESVIGNINDNGYLSCSIEDIAESNKTTKSQVEKVLTLIQTFDPIGVGARDLRECLLIQLKAKQEEKFLPAGPLRRSFSEASRQALAGQIVDKYLSCLEKKRYGYIAKKLKVSVEEIKKAMKEIANLEPKPGRSFSTERTVRLVPDAILRKNKDGYEVILNDWELPQITLNDKYRKMIKEKDIPDDAKKYLLERLNAAKALIGAIGKRRETIQKVIEDIVNFQKESLDNEIGNFKPMTLSEIADRIGKHKSTVSRAIANKYLQTPQGILELRQFLNSGIKQENGKYYSSKNIKLKILGWIKNEDKKKPLADQEIVNLLKRDGITVSRRTIAKYRNQLKILSSKSR